MFSQQITPFLTSTFKVFSFDAPASNAVLVRSCGHSASHLWKSDSVAESFRSNVRRSGRKTAFDAGASNEKTLKVLLRSGLTISSLGEASGTVSKSCPPGNAAECGKDDRLPESTLQPETVRLAHLSDLHLPVKPLGWRWRDYFSKRLTGFIHIRWLGRSKRFRHAAKVLTALMRSLPERRIDHVLFSGDASMMGFRREFEEVASLLHLDTPAMLPGLTVPGNHDCYVRSAVRRGDFERIFAPWQKGLRIDLHHTYPFAQKVGSIWLVALNSARSNRIVWDARGGVGKAQRERLRELLKRLEEGPKIIVTHYPLFLENGKPETTWRRMRDWKKVLRIAREGGVSLWLHGHRHHPYHLSKSESLPFPSICVGSSTQTDRWTYNEYEIKGTQIEVLRRQYDPDRDEFVDRDRFRIELAACTPS